MTDRSNTSVAPPTTPSPPRGMNPGLVSPCQGRDLLILRSHFAPRFVVVPGLDEGVLSSETIASQMFVRPTTHLRHHVVMSLGCLISGIVGCAGLPPLPTYVITLL